MMIRGETPIPGKRNRKAWSDRGFAIARTLFIYNTKRARCSAARQAAEFGMNLAA